MRGLYSHSRELRKIFSRNHVRILATCLKELIRCKCMSRLYSHLREDRYKLLANQLCIGFVPGGNLLTHELFEQAINPGPTSQLTRKRCLFSWVQRRTHKLFCPINRPSTGP